MVNHLFGIFKKNSEKFSSRLNFFDSDEVYEVGKDLVFAQPIEDLSKNAVREIVRNEASAYRWLGYAKKETDKLHDFEWHNWQVSYIARAIKDQTCIPIFQKDSFFPKEILQIKKTQLAFKTNALMQKFSTNVDPKKDREILHKEIQWTPFEIGIMFYYLSELCNSK